MNAKKESGSPEWTDPDDAPELGAAFFESAEIKHGDRVIRRGRPPTGNAKPVVSLRLDVDVLAKLREGGPGWQTRVNDILRAAVIGPTDPGGAGGRKQTFTAERFPIRNTAPDLTLRGAKKAPPKERV